MTFNANLSSFGLSKTLSRPTTDKPLVWEFVRFPTQLLCGDSASPAPNLFGTSILPFDLPPKTFLGSHSTLRGSPGSGDRPSSCLGFSYSATLGRGFP